MRHVSRRIFALVGLLLWAICSQSATAQNHIDAELVVEQTPRPGESVDIALHFRPQENWHGYWSNPGDAGYGMELDWQLPAGWVVDDVRYPVPETFLVSGLMNHVYARDYAVIMALSLPADAVLAGGLKLAVNAQWLACDDKVCVPERARLEAMIAPRQNTAADPRFDGWRAALPPMLDRPGAFARAGGMLQLAIPIPAAVELADPHVFIASDGLVDYAAPQQFWRNGDWVVAHIPMKGGVAGASSVAGILKLDNGANGANGVRFQAAPGTVPTGGETIGQSADMPPLWSLLLAAMAGGLLLNIMPCVFPILSLKALTLARAGESQSAAKREALSYTAGVIVATLALGAVLLALRAAGNEVGWAFQLQEPGVVAALLVLTVAITANFAGLYELPGFALAGNGGSGGAFSTGLLASFVATPCTGPFMAAAMGAALLLPNWAALLLFAALGLGLALPFLALGFLPRLRAMLPRPGNWMHVFRKAMALPMGLTALALLWLCWRLGGHWFALFALLAAIAGVFVLGLAARGRGQGRIGAGVYAGLGLIGFAALMGAAWQTYAPRNHQAGGQMLAAQPFGQQALADARARGAPVFLWFTADWCVTCKVNESVAIERASTKAAFERAGVVAMVGDWTRRDPEITRFLTAQGAAGVPLYLWYPPGGDGQQLPQVLTPAMLSDLARGLPPAAQSPAVRPPAAQSPAAQSPAAQSPAAQSPAVRPPAARPASGTN